MSAILAPVKVPLGSILLQKGLVTAEHLEVALCRQKEDHVKLGQTLIHLGFLSGMDLVSALSAQSHREYIKVHDCLIDRRVLEQVPRKVAVTYGAIPLLRVGGTLLVGMVEGPHAGDNLQQMAREIQCELEPIFLARGVDLAKEIDYVYATHLNRRARDRNLGESLVAQGMLTREELDIAHDVQRKTGQRLGDVLVMQGYMTSARLYEALAAHFEMPLAHLDQVRPEIRPEIARLVQRPFAEHNLVLPYAKQDDSIRVLTAGPIDKWLEDFLLDAARAKQVQLYLSPADDIRQAILEAYNHREVKKDECTQPDVEVTDVQQDVTPEGPLVVDQEVPRLVNSLLYFAVRKGASDIHIEQFENRVLTRLRIDGVLRPCAESPIDKENVLRVIAKIKIDACLDISERRRPQDGSFLKRFGSEREVAFRVAATPTVNGENVTLRILDRTRRLPPLDQLGFQDSVLERYRRLIDNPQGMVLFTGPTGCGKTTSLYATLDALSKRPIKIITAEDPVEYHFEGIQQCPVNDVIDNTFANLLRSFLRGDPDVILVGEIRDSVTATTALRAALTGHLLFSTLHTNDVISTVRRLTNLGIEADMLADALLGVVSQRLVRKICPACRVTRVPPKEVYQELYPQGLPAGVSFTAGRGCEECDGTGYHGQVPVFEFWGVTEREKVGIRRGADESELRDAALQNGMISMIEDGLRKVAAGITTLEELREVIPYQQLLLHRERLLAGEPGK